MMRALLGMFVLIVGATPLMAQRNFIDQPGSVDGDVFTVPAGSTVDAGGADEPAARIGRGTLNILGAAAGNAQNDAVQVVRRGTVNVGATGAVQGAVNFLGQDSGTVALNNSGRIAGTITVQGTVAGSILNAGTLDGGGGDAIALGNGDDIVTLRDASQTLGAIAGGAGTDRISITGSGTWTGVAQGVENLVKSGAGTFTWDGSAQDADALMSIALSAGTLAIGSGTSTVRVDSTDVGINSGSTLLVREGAELRAGTITAGGTGSGLTLGAGGTGTGLANVTGAATFESGTALNVTATGELRAASLTLNAATATVSGLATLAGALTLTDARMSLTSTGRLTGGASTFTNASVQVARGGRLAVDATYENSRVTLDGTQGGSVTLGASSRLSGIGTVTGNLSVGAGATLAPGNSPGTITINGDLTLDPSSVTEIEFSNAQSDLIHVDGTATLGGTLRIILLEAPLGSTTVTVIESPNDDFVRAFDAIPDASTPIFTITTRQNTRTFDLVITRNTYQSAGSSANQRRIGAQLDLFAASGAAALTPLTRAIDALATRAAIGDAYDRLSPEPYDTVAHTAFQLAYHTAGQLEQYLLAARLNLPDARGGRVDDVLPSRAAGVPAQHGFLDPARRTGSFAFAYDLDVDTDTLRDANGAVKRSGAAFRGRGFLAGADHRIGDEAVIGLTVGSGGTRSDLCDGRGRIESDPWQVGAYGTWARRGTYVDGLALWQGQEVTARRVVAFSGFAEALRARFDANAFTLFGGAGHMFNSGTWQWGPTLTFQYTSFGQDGFTEAGGSTALDVARRDVESLRGQLGLRLTQRYDVTDRVELVPELRLRWAHEFEDDDPALIARFVGSPGLPAFEQQPGRPDRDTVLVGGSVNAYFGRNCNAYVNYDAELERERANVHAARAGVAVKF